MNCSEFNQMLDLYIDGELSDSQREELEAHAAQCSACREKLADSEQLREILSHMDDDISVPLPAQAAWRNAVRIEAKRNRMKKVYSICGAVAAVCVLTVGMTAMLGQNFPASVAPVSPRIETDGVSVDAGIEENISLTSAKTRSIEYIDYSIEAEDPAQAYGYLGDVIAEYGGMIERESNGDVKTVFVQIPGENVKDFVNAVDSLGASASDMSAAVIDESAEMVGICITITVG